ncbi:MAG: insulinase family protein [Gammaproteobacteria bacterium]|nr:insulinase family protein [Gammaproteobacteria bacterium]
MRHLLIFFGLWFTLLNAASATSTPPIQRWQTKQGTPVIFYQAMDIPMLSISLAFRAGAAYDEQRFGLSTLTTRLLNQGNDGLDANTLANRLAETGAQFSSENNRDMIVLHLKTLTEKEALKQATNLFTRIVKQPDFPKKAFEREKNQQQMAIRQALESPDEVANQTFFRALYQAHPYAHPINGDLNTLNAITLKDVQHFHQTFFVAQNATLVLVGALNRKDAEALAEKITLTIPKGKKAPMIPDAKPLPESMDVNVPFPSSQTVLRLGQLGINHHDTRYFPLLVGNYTLGGGALVSRLAEELREKRGLTYGVHSQFVPMPERGPFVIGFSTKNEQAETAETLTRDTLEAFVKTGPSNAELKAAKQYLIGSFPLSIASNQSMASILLKMAFYGLPDNYLDTYTDNINAVSTQQIQSAFQKSVHPKRLLQVMVGKL